MTVIIVTFLFYYIGFDPAVIISFCSSLSVIPFICRQFNDIRYFSKLGLVNWGLSQIRKNNIVSHTHTVSEWEDSNNEKKENKNKKACSSMQEHSMYENRIFLFRFISFTFIVFFVFLSCSFSSFTLHVSECVLLVYAVCPLYGSVCVWVFKLYYINSIAYVCLCEYEEKTTTKKKWITEMWAKATRRETETERGKLI